MEEKFVKAAELLKDRDFIERLNKIESIEETKKILAERGLEWSNEEIQELANEIKNGVNEELADDALEEVSGGVSAALVIGGTIGVLALLAAAKHAIDKARYGRP